MTADAPMPPSAERADELAPDAAWSAVLGAALLGTERRPWAGSHVHGLPTLPAGAGGLLHSAALLTVWRDTGRTVAPPPVPPLPPPPSDPRPVVGAEPRRLLAPLLQDRRQTALLDEWLASAAASGQRLPGALLVDLLQVPALPDARRELIRSIGGPLLGWLAAHNPEWLPPASLPLDQFSPDRWADSADEARLAAFARLRATDPRGAAELLGRVLPDESAAVAVALVEALADGLSADDTDLLERALDDRRKRVRAAAATLLDRLPTSPRAQRLTALAVPAVTVSGLLRRTLSVVELPPPDEAQERDGVVGTPPERLRIAVGGAALDAWEARLGRPPAELARLATGSQESLARVLLDGWLHAAVRQRSQPWVRALLDAGLPPSDELLAVLDADEADQRLAAAVTRTELVALPGLIGANTRPWGPQASTAAIGAVSRIVSRVDLTNRPDPALTRAALALQSALAPLALRLHPQTDPTPLVEATSRAPTPSFWLQSVAGGGAGPTGLAGILAFRAALASAFPATASPATAIPTPTPTSTPAPGSSP